jgi:hypothetical protein
MQTPDEDQLLSLDTSEPEVIPPNNAGPKDGDVPVELLDQAPFDLGRKVEDL